MSRVTKAVIPAGGRGTRMHPVTRVLPKELLPLANRPVLDYVLEEVAAASIAEVAVVVSPEKPLIRTYVERVLGEEGRWSELSFEWLVQESPRGLADAVSLCREFAAGEPFALLLPDNLLLAPRYRLRTLLDLFEEKGRDVLGVVEVGHERSGSYGNSGRIEFVRERPGILRISRLHDKLPGRLEVPRGEVVRRTCGRYVCVEDFFEQAERLRPSEGEEFDEVPVYQEIIRQRGAYGYVLPPPVFDVGDPHGYLEACAHLLKEGSIEARRLCS